MVRVLTGRRLLITGASSGIGRCLAEQAAEAGAHLVLAARSADKLEEVARSLARPTAPVVAVPADVSREEDRQRLIQTTVHELGGLDVLVNNAGVASHGHFGTSSETVLREVMEVNFFAPAELIRLAIPHLRYARQPAVVNVASMCGRRGIPAYTEYSASKFALCGLTEALRGEMARFDIDVLLVVLGLTRTEFASHQLRRDGRFQIEFDKGMEPEDVARDVLRALVKNRTEVVLGREARWLLRVNRFLPRLVDRLMARKVRQLYGQA